MDLGYIFVFIGISILSCLNCKNSAIGMIEKIGITSSHYPKRYISPVKWVRSIFKVKQNLIPRFLYFELVLSLIFAILGPINLIICIIVDYSSVVVGILIMLHIGLVILNMIFFSIMSLLIK